jgi:hypothetical protein
LEAALPPDVATLNNLRSEVNAPWRSIDAGALHHIHHTTLRQEDKAQRHFALTISLCVIVLCLVVYLSIRNRIRQLPSQCLSKTTPVSLKVGLAPRLTPRTRRRHNALRQNKTRPYPVRPSRSIQPNTLPSL